MFDANTPRVTDARVGCTPSKQCFYGHISLHITCIIYTLYPVYMVMTGAEILDVHLHRQSKKKFSQ